jgi:hypothetical protein
MGEIEFDIDNVEKTTVKEMFEKHEIEFKKKHPIYFWIDGIFKGSLFGYAPHYALTHPLMLLGDLKDQIKWAYQRVFRGWDDRASWSIDYWLDSMLPDILMRLKETSHGIPMRFFDGLPHDDNYDYGESGDKIARKLWNEELDKMIAGFVCSKKINDYEYKTDEERKILEQVFDKGMKSFIENYHSLWD